MNGEVANAIVTPIRSFTQEEIIRNNGIALVEGVKSTLVVDEASFRRATEMTREVKKQQKKVEEYWEPLRAGTKKAYDDVLARKREMLNPLKEAEEILKKKSEDYLDRKKQIRREQEEKLRRNAQKQLEIKQAEYEKAQKIGDMWAAEYVIAEMEVLESMANVASVAAEKPNAKGVSVSKSWEITSIDSAKVPIFFNNTVIRPVDEKIVLKMIKTSNGTIHIPGVEYKEVSKISVRT